MAAVVTALMARRWGTAAEVKSARNCERSLKEKKAPRYEDFQSSCRSGTMCHHRSLLVSIQAFNGGLRQPLLPIQTHSVVWFFQSIFKAGRRSVIRAALDNRTHFASMCLTRFIPMSNHHSAFGFHHLPPGLVS